MKQETTTYRLTIYYRSRMAKDNVYSFTVPRKCLSFDLTKLFLSRSRIDKCEFNSCLSYDDCLDFSLDSCFCDPDYFLDVYFSRSEKLYRLCRG